MKSIEHQMQDYKELMKNLEYTFHKDQEEVINLGKYKD